MKANFIKTLEVSKMITAEDLLLTQTINKLKKEEKAKYEKDGKVLKYDEGKPRWHILPWDALEMVILLLKKA